MKKFGSMISIALAVVMALSLCSVAFAADNEITTSGGTATVPVSLTAEAATFSATVPTSLPVSVAADGTVTVATDAKIVNHSHGMIAVQGLTVSGTNSWNTVAYDSADAGAMPVNTKSVALVINGEKTTGANTISFTASNWAALDAACATTDDELPITYSAIVPAQSTAMSGSAIANVVFTLGWHTA